ncbi:AlbA family DNA-binding domain-containing protein [Methylobacterium nodulans]|uniref:AlbA family DNA-binding domain-containing protein n=1 Tax=Methylobacterium nodulans TaxID=114616 RepID=UPI0012ECFB00|nr:ATP-binding protein [Methylobacterium nodulans]
MNVELKRWIDPTDPKGIAKIALAAIALRNRNGGYLVIGFDNDTLSPDPNNKPANVRAAFHVDIIQGIISKYVSNPFEIQIGFAERGGQEFPIIAVPEGTTVPVAAKGDLPDPTNKHKFLIRADTVYFRTLNSNGRPSTSAAKASDWRDIVEICFENREADIGRFLRRHLGGENLLRFITNAQEKLAALKPVPTATEHARMVLEAGKKFRDEAIADRQLSARDQELLKCGTWSAALAIDPPLPATDSNHEFLNTIFGSNPQYTGWPVWLDSRPFADERHRPYKKQKAWEALILSTQAGLMSSHVDFLRMDAKGEFYLWRVLQDDMTDKVEPKTQLDPALMVYRVAEVIAVGISFARALGCDETSTLGFCFEWDNLKGRTLSSWANPELYFSKRGKIQDNTVSTCIEVPLTTPLPSIVPYVSQAVADLFSAFDGFVYSERGIEQRVEKLLSRQW